MRGSGLTTCSGLRKDVVNYDTAGLQEFQTDQKKDLMAVWRLHKCAAGLPTKHLCNYSLHL